MSDSERDFVSFARKELAPLPWKRQKILSASPHLYRLVDAHGLTVLLIPGKASTGTGDRAKEIAEYVLDAANSHEELLHAARMAVNDHEDLGWELSAYTLETLRKAIAKTRKGKS